MNGSYGDHDPIFIQELKPLHATAEVDKYSIDQLVINNLEYSFLSDIQDGHIPNNG